MRETNMPFHDADDLSLDGRPESFVNRLSESPFDRLDARLGTRSRERKDISGARGKRV